MNKYVVRTKNGYLGKWTTGDTLVDTMPYALAYTWDESIARDLATAWGGTLVAVN